MAIVTEPTGKHLPYYSIRMNKAIKLANAGKCGQAIRILLLLARKYPEAASVYAYLAWYSSELGRNREALKQSRKAIILAPRSETVSLIRYKTLVKARKYYDALGEMKRFLKIQPSKVYSNIIKAWEPNSRKPLKGMERSTRQKEPK
jgi:predicted Zn-dependent protease